MFAVGFAVEYHIDIVFSRNVRLAGLLVYVYTRVSCFSQKLSRLSGNEICQYSINNNKIS